MSPPTPRIVRGPVGSEAIAAPLRGPGGPQLKPDAFAAKPAAEASAPKKKSKPVKAVIAEPTGDTTKRDTKRSDATPHAANVAQTTADIYNLQSIFRPMRDTDFLLRQLKAASAGVARTRAKSRNAAVGAVNRTKPETGERLGQASLRRISSQASETMDRLRRFERRARSRVYHKVEAARAGLSDVFAGPSDPLGELEIAARGRTVANRIEQLCDLERDEIEFIRNFATSEPKIHQSGSEIVGERERSPDPIFITSGWAARVRILSGGRRQIIGFLLPGDPIGLRGAAEPDAATSIGAITQVEAIDARNLLAQVERSNRYPGLERAIQRAEAQEKEFLFNQITRLGAMKPHERLEDLMRELKWRLRQTRLANEKMFPMPLDRRALSATLNLDNGELKSAMRKLRRQHGFRIRNNAARIAELDGEGESAPGKFRPPAASRAPGGAPLPRIISS